MKAKILDVKKIVKSEGGTPPPGGGSGKPPKNIENWEDDKQKQDPKGEGGEEGGEEGGDDDAGNKSGQPGDPGKEGGSGRGEQWKEIEPADPTATYEVTPWKQPKGKSVIGEVLPAGELGEGTKDPEQTKEKWKQITTDSLTQGSVPGGIREALNRMRTPVVDWKKELEVFIDNAISKSKYVLPSRRFLGQGKAQYGYKKYREDFECVVVAIDTSGSISDKMVAQFLSETKAIVDAYSPQDLYIIFCHTDIYRVDHIQPGEELQLGKLQSGGTEFYPPFEWVEKNLISQGIIPSAFLYFTDGEATFPNASEYSIGEYEDKCLWVLLTWNGRPFPNEIPFGGRIDITLPNKDVESI